MKRYYCTYFDINYLPQGLVLLESLQQHSESDFTLYVLCLDEKVYDFFRSGEQNNVLPIALKDLEIYDKELLSAKNYRSWAEYIFTITPCFLNYLLENISEIDIINYIDSDIMFFATPEIIFTEFGQGSIFIIPHNFSDSNKHLEIYGKYNVGFVGFRKDMNGSKCIKWWREKCIEWCYDKLDGDRFADQKYLDQWPGLFDRVVVSKNPALNLAPYNIDNFRIIKVKKEFFINDHVLVFFHYHRLKEINSFIWKLNLFNSNDYKNPVIKNIYSIIISRIKYYKKMNGSGGNTNNRFEINSKTNLLLELKANIVLIHFGIINCIVDLRTPFSIILHYYNRIKPS